ncbi:golgi pH regulator [Pycnococcus provasolii]
MSAIPPLVLSLPHILIYLSSYTVSYFTITHKLYLYDKKDPVALFLFALTFAFASHTLLLLFIDGAAPSLLPAPSRRVLWHVDVYMQLCLVGFFVPVYASWTVVKQSRPMWSVKRRLAASCALALALEVVAARIAARLPSPPPLPPPDALAEENAWEAAAATLRAWWPPGAMVRRLSVLGVLLNAPLSGYGSVHLPHSLMDAFAVPVRARDVDELARRVKDTEALARDAESRGGSTGEKTSLRRRGGGGSTRHILRVCGRRIAALAPSRAAHVRARRSQTCGEALRLARHSARSRVECRGMCTQRRGRREILLGVVQVCACTSTGS